mmetsp:Transcript_8235/g.21132  ORF Transcript_8235/g.21132 Transcript_8235/m.21132 type:complete len:186 (-) Transcript_8235:206-763(-)|eukprot:jgi/Tetstr1/432009/TSEL_021485.t1
MPHEYEYPRPAVTVDAVIVAQGRAPQTGCCGAVVTASSKVPHVLLIKRGLPPFKDCWALPGGFVNADETLHAAAVRELQEETSVDPNEVQMHQLGAFGDPGRDPRGWTITVAYGCIIAHTGLRVEAADDAAAVQWYPLDKLASLELAFDHRMVLSKSLERLAELSKAMPVEFKAKLISTATSLKP